MARRLRDSLTAERLREVLHYDPETGVFTRLEDSPRGQWKAGMVAGGLTEGYLLITVDGVRYRANRLAWLYMMGRWPEGLVDHRNGRKGDNRFDNLRDATDAVNTQNQREARSDNRSSGILGVTWDAARGKWLSQIGVGKAKRFLGRFETTDEASAAYLAAKRVLHEGCTI